MEFPCYDTAFSKIDVNIKQKDLENLWITKSAKDKKNFVESF